MNGQYTDAQLTHDIAAAGKTAPRVTPESIDQIIEEAQYWRPDNTTMTICVLTLENGYTVVGHSASASAENFDAEIGRKLAFDHARSQVWALEGYLLRQHLHDQETHPVQTISLADQGFTEVGTSEDGVDIR